MSDVAIRVEGLGKKYRKGRASQYFREQLMNALHGEKAAEDTDFWALQDINFEIKKGEAVGIIGRNGAGKSTLLKILSRITHPSTGSFELNGRVSSLLEVGTGFHMELTGRENIFLNGTILGMKRWEIRQKLDEIIDFSGVEKFLDTPVKHYSSGMKVRLAFSVAAHLEPEILFIDEVLAVGDAEFQKKCLGKMDDVTKNEGRTVLFVSHNMSAVQHLCPVSILLNKGLLMAKDNTQRVVSQYLIKASHTNQFKTEKKEDKEIQILKAELFENEDYLDVSIMAHSKIETKASVDFRISDPTGIPVAFGSRGSFEENTQLYVKKGDNNISFRILTRQMAVGKYFLSLDLTIPDIKFFDRIEQALTFEVIRAPKLGKRRVLSQSWGYGCYEIPIQLLDDA